MGLKYIASPKFSKGSSVFMFDILINGVILPLNWDGTEDLSLSWLRNQPKANTKHSLTYILLVTSPIYLGILTQIKRFGTLSPLETVPSHGLVLRSGNSSWYHISWLSGWCSLILLNVLAWKRHLLELHSCTLPFLKRIHCSLDNPLSKGFQD